MGEGRTENWQSLSYSAAEPTIYRRLSVSTGETDMAKHMRAFGHYFGEEMLGIEQV